MKLKVSQVFDAAMTVTQIINEKRPMPQKGAYRLARMHAKLLPEFTTIANQRDALIIAYDHHEMVSGPKTKEDPLGQILVPAAECSVPKDKMGEFLENWKKIADEEIEVDVEPIPLAQLDFGGDAVATVSASELVSLGELVRDD